MLPLLALTMLSNYLSKDPILDGWRNVPKEARARMYWRVFGPAWDRANIDRQLKILKASGVGGVMTYLMYPEDVDKPGAWHNQRFNSPEFLDNFAFAADTANRLGLRFSMCGSTGWPFGGSQVTVQDSAQKLQTGTGHATTGTLQFDKPFVTDPADQIIAIFQNGKLVNQPTDGPFTAFVETPTRMLVKRASLGNEGLVVDHLNRVAVERYMNSTILPWQSTRPKKIESIFSDSLEVYRQNWTHDFPAAFVKARGYDLIPHLLDLFDDHSALAPSLRQDFWRTVAELANTQYVKTVYDWSHAHNMAVELQPYGTPPLPMTSSAYIDMPTGEHYEWRGFNVCRYVASAAHQQGRNIIGSEAWTWGAIPNRLTDTLSDLKVMSDMHFLSGVNDITGVDFPYSPKAAGNPGWLPYYGPSIGENNPQWAVFPDLVQYLNRCSWLLRQGKPNAQVAIYLPIEDGMAKGGTEQLLLDFAVRDHFVTGPATSEFGLQKAMMHRSDLVEALNHSGIEFDGVDFWSLIEQGRVEKLDGKAVLRVGNATYQALIIPRIESIDIEALRKIDEFASAGGIVSCVGQPPKLASGLVPEAVQAETVTLSTKLFGPESNASHHHLVFANDADVSQLATLGLNSATLKVAPGNCALISRVLPDRTIYFLANPTDSGTIIEFTPHGTPSHLEQWNAMTGVRTIRRTGIMTIQLAPRESTFIIATNGPEVADTEPNEPLKTITQLVKPDSGWDLSFVGPDAPKAVHLNAMQRWEIIPTAKGFSGGGRYSASFQINQTGYQRVVFGLPDVHNAAILLINGHQVGSIWNPPLELDITRFVHAGTNKVEIRVYNSMANRFISLPDPDMKGLRAKYGSRFQAPEEKQLMKEPDPSGVSQAPYLKISYRTEHTH